MSGTHHGVERLDLNLLVVLDALLRERSVTRAAKALGLTQSAMSHSLARLRQFFDDPLFVKTHRGVAPTAKAESLAPAILAVMETVRDQILAEARFDPSRLKRAFTFCLSDMGELVFLPRIVENLKTMAPACRVHTLQVAPTQLASVLGSGEGDLALGSVLNATEGLYEETLFDHTFVCIVSVRHPTAGDALTLAEYQAMPHIAVTLTGDPRTPYDAAVEASGIKRDIRILTPHFLIIPLLLDQHPEFVATVPRELGTVFARHGIVRMIEPPMGLPTFALKQYWHPRFHHDRASRWLREMMRTTFHTLPQPLR